jgi:3-hydroxyisobutyrate dehydrogenase-like beta-hydroxyacid dehydrogenase
VIALKYTDLDTSGTVLVIGLGPIGAGMAARLHGAGIKVHGLDLDAERAEVWSNETGAPASHAFDTVPWADVTVAIAAVRLASQVENLIGDLTKSASALRTLIVATTLPVEAARSIGREAAKRWSYYESPVSGGTVGAANGTLTLYVAGPPVQDNMLTSLFAAISQTKFEFPHYGEPALAKLLNNALGALNVQALTSFMVLAKDHGLDPQLFLDICNVSSGGSWMSENFDAFDHDLLIKDVELLREEIPVLPAIGFGNHKLAGAIVQQARQAIDEAQDRGGELVA